jgi:hypothetical protein
VARQNRVTPLGELIATPVRGNLMGNRGCLHDTEGRIRRAFVGRRWIICVLQFKGRRRPIMAPGRYTELFFLDEATALAAGHRPCMECQRGRYLLFREHWMAARAPTEAPPSVDDIDRVLHAERLRTSRSRRTYRERVSRLPEGAMVVDRDHGPCLVSTGSLRPWSPAGYRAPVWPDRDAEVDVLTPRSLVGALAHGYPVEVHASARAAT